MTSPSHDDHPWSAFEVGLVTLELESPLLVGAAEGDNLFDAVFVTDANGLPCIPGESLAGVLRHALAGGGDPDTHARCRQVFGYQQRAEGEASRIRISFAHAHGRDDLPVPFRGAPKDDEVLAFLQSGVGRDHVRIGMHGAAEDRGKFDELAVPAGARFTFEICLSHQAGISLAELVGLLGRPEVRLGRGTRRGLGCFQVKRVLHACFDLSKGKDLERLATLHVALDQAVRSAILKPLDLPAPMPGDGWAHGVLTLAPLGTWGVGGGIPTGLEPEREEEKAGTPWDRVPLTERRIVWKNQGERDQGAVQSGEEAAFVVPASAVKGALRHRTAFHARRLAKAWLDPEDVSSPEATEAEAALFGEVRETLDGRPEGHPGRVHLADLYVSQGVERVPLQHVSLDRFTQGPMDHLLYDEVSLVGGRLQFSLDVRVDQGLKPEHRMAFQAALDDLCQGRLAFGAGRGHGRFTGTVEWTKPSNWLQEATHA